MQFEQQQESNNFTIKDKLHSNENNTNDVAYKCISFDGGGKKERVENTSNQL